ncbi:SDR family NAD(P)-dependent oxidoreductase [Hymenobacter properus]|uniref:SDR family NAD(P)-dependent oxidoreductase n=1 Tax=Hymenobacter properus TaxID=2791026 RepID=A0A931FK07_9BACT|nr:SDR family NAD(P)-dependent oxidoreductase [Hymenobacter properus]MBF9141165.1 SDR family NAD(P)-dependent oxidoreductase [Hymenobacter properus]MBR7719974.1 SDR family NAD(P)-dependent oxidoreductase [Microvirga sp. SRT04]
MPSLNQFFLADKVVVITGATGVLGASMSLAVAEAGAKVAILGRNAERAEARAAAIRAIGGECLVVLADVLDVDQMQAACDTIMHTWGRIDGLVNAAGGNIPGATVGPGQNLFDLGIEDTRRAVDCETVVVDGGFNAFSGV